jgi:hypothetical protein
MVEMTADSKAGPLLELMVFVKVLNLVPALMVLFVQMVTESAD